MKPTMDRYHDSSEQLSIYQYNYIALLIVILSLGRGGGGGDPNRRVESVGHLSGDFSDSTSLQYYILKGKPLRELCQELLNSASMLEHISMN